MRCFLPLCILFFFTLFAQEQELVTQDGILLSERITAVMPEMIIPKQIVISSEGKIDQDEIRYLCHLQENSPTYQQDILTGLAYCMKKKQFASIFFSWNQEKQILHLHFILFYCIKKVHFKGISYDVENYKRLYGAEKYEPFGPEKHAQGMQAMLDYMHTIGYWDAQIKDAVVYDEKKRYVTIFFELHFGSCYTVKDCVLVLDHALLQYQNRITSLFEKQVTKTIRGKKYNQAQLNAALSHCTTQLYDAGFLCKNFMVTEKIDTDTKTVSLQFVLHHNYPYRIAFTGNTFFSDKKLYHHLRVTFHHEQMISSSIIMQALIDLYKKEGFLATQIRQQITKNEKSTENTEHIFFIQEGVRFTIQDIQISFLDSTAETYNPYHTFLTKKLHGHIASSHYVSEIVSTCLSRMKDDGFLDAQVMHYSIEKKDHNTATVSMYLDPKKQHIIESIELQTAQCETLLSCLPSFALNHTIILTPGMLVQQQQLIEKSLQQSGYLHASVFPEIVSETLVWHIHPGKQTTVGAIIIQGNPELSFSRIKKCINLPRNSYLQQTNIQESMHTLQKLGIYERVELYPDTAENSDLKKAALNDSSLFQPVIVHLIPGNPCELRLRLGGELQHIQNYQSFNGISYKVGCSFIVKNSARLADTLQCDVDFAASHREIVTSWSIPFVFYKTIALPISALWHAKAQAYHMRFDNPGAIGYPKNIYTIGRDGFLFSIGNTKDTSYFNINAGFEQQKTSITDQKNAIELSRALNFDSAELSKPIPYALLDINFLFDFLDHALYPTRGISSLCGIKTMIPIHDFSTYYVKLMFQQTFFFPLFGCTFGLRARFGYLFHKDFSKIAPAERFYLGGSHSVRGYEADYFPPISPFTDSYGKETIVPRGGKIMANVNIEVTKKLWSLLSVAFFHDIGALADNLKTITTMLPLHASGFGIRLETPFGPLRFDIGYKWQKTSLEERSYAWYLSFGRSF
jgi:outer membrane protein assembly factor BamA